MALDYTYLKYKDVHTITNNDDVTFSYTVSNVTCDGETEISTGIILPDTTKEISFNFDGNYIILLDDGDEQATIEVKIYNNLLLSFISSVESTLCGCKKCNDCEECTECDDFLSALIIAIAFATVNEEIYQTELQAAMAGLNCDFTDTIRCILIQEQVYGHSDTLELLKKILALYYLTFYTTDLLSAIDAEEEAYITTKYNFTKIAKCIRKLGIDPTAIKDLITEASCQSWEWNFGGVDDEQLISITYINCEGELVIIQDLKKNLVSPMTICSNGVQPTILFGSLTQGDTC